jgi:hypothetical protein
VGRWAFRLVSMSYSPDWNIVADGCARALVADIRIQFPAWFSLSLGRMAHERNVNETWREVCLPGVR